MRADILHEYARRVASLSRQSVAIVRTSLITARKGVTRTFKATASSIKTILVLVRNARLALRTWLGEHSLLISLLVVAVLLVGVIGIVFVGGYALLSGLAVIVVGSIIKLLMQIPSRYYVFGIATACAWLMLYVARFLNTIELRSQTSSYHGKLLAFVTILFLAARFGGQIDKAIIIPLQNNVARGFEERSNLQSASAGLSERIDVHTAVGGIENALSQLQSLPPDLLRGMIACAAFYYAIGYFYCYLRDVMGIALSEKPKAKTGRIGFIPAAVIGIPKGVFDIIVPSLALYIVAWGHCGHIYMFAEETGKWLYGSVLHDIISPVAKDFNSIPYSRTIASAASSAWRDVVAVLGEIGGHASRVWADFAEQVAIYIENHPEESDAQ